MPVTEPISFSAAGETRPQSACSSSSLCLSPPPRPAPSPVAAVAVNNAPRAYGRRKARDRNAVRAGSGDIQEAKSRLAGKKEKGEPRKRAWDRRRIFRKSVIGMNAERKARARAHTQRERERERERKLLY